MSWKQSEKKVQRELKHNTMEKQKNYIIVCTWPDEEWLVQEYVTTNWIKEHRCAAKGEEGYKEAKRWIDKIDEEGGKR